MDLNLIELIFVENREIFDVEEVFSTGNSGSFDETNHFG